MKKILVLVNHDIVIYNFRKELIEKMIENGYEVHFSCPLGDNTSKLIEMGAIHHDIEIERHGMNIKSEVKLLRNYLKLMKMIKPEVVLTYTIKPNIYGGIAARLLKIPYLVNITGLGGSLQGGGNVAKILIKMYSLSLKGAQTVYFQNQDNLDFLTSKCRINNRVVLLPGSGVNTKEFEFKKLIPKTEPVILYLGRLMEDKGIFELLEAFKRLPEINLQLVGFIDDEKIDTVLNGILEDFPNIEYLGFKTDVAKYIMQADAIILPSYHEGLSNVLLESGAMGRPLLASNIGGCKETILVEKTGFLFEPYSVEGIIDAVTKFNKLTFDEKQEMGVQSRVHIKKMFDRTIVVNEYIKNIGEILC